MVALGNAGPGWRKKVGVGFQYTALLTRTTPVSTGLPQRSQAPAPGLAWSDMGQMYRHLDQDPSRGPRLSSSRDPDPGPGRVPRGPRAGGAARQGRGCAPQGRLG